MKHTFLKMSNGGWYFLVDNEEAAKAVLDWKSNILAHAWMFDMELDGHCKTNYSNACETILQVEMLKTGKKQMSMPECINLLEQRMTEPFLKYFYEYGKVLVNPAAGFMLHDGSYEVLKTIVKDDFIFPKNKEEEVRIIHWQDGSHYYAKIGKEDVVWDGEQKWGTRQAAEAAAEKYIEANNE